MRRSTLLAVLIIVLCGMIGIMFPSCIPIHQVSPYWYSGEEPIKSRSEIADSTWNKFLECSKDMGDAGCDSCWQAIVEKGQ